MLVIFIIIFEFLLLAIAIIIALFALFLSLSFFFGPPFVPTPKPVVKEMLTLVGAKKQDVLLDLGSGDGTVLIEAAKMGINARGFEINPFLFLLAKIKARSKNLNKNIEVYNQDYQKANLKDVTIVFCYGLPKFMTTISEKLRIELPKSAKVASYKFPIPNLKLVKKTKTDIFLYTLKK